VIYLTNPEQYTHQSLHVLQSAIALPNIGPTRSEGSVQLSSTYANDIVRGASCSVLMHKAGEALPTPCIVQLTKIPPVGTTCDGSHLYHSFISLLGHHHLVESGRSHLLA
jgi:hypothetical protein